MKRLAVLSMIAAAMLLAYAPAGWKWGGKNDAHAGWSWNADIAAVNGNTVTLVSRKGNTLTLTPVAGADAVVGGDVTVVQSGLVWSADTGGTVDQPLGWTWNG
jgi:hypothetical protein